jgi:hypothetical protein
VQSVHACALTFAGVQDRPVEEQDAVWVYTALREAASAWAINHWATSRAVSL